MNLVFSFHRQWIKIGGQLGKKLFIKQLLAHHPRRHLVIVMDRASCHTVKKVKEFVSLQKRLHVFFLSPRSPEFNPDE